MKNHIRVLFPLALALMLVGAGCGSSSTPPPTAETPSAPATESQTGAYAEPTAQTVPAAEGVTVAISNFAFSPSSVTVKQGTTITWKQEDSVPHTVTGDKGGPDSQLLKSGETYTYKFENPGTFAYHCATHPKMKGTVVVEK